VNEGIVWLRLLAVSGSYWQLTIYLIPAAIKGKVLKVKVGSNLWESFECQASGAV
jgi:hypothetical protein